MSVTVSRSGPDNVLRVLAELEALPTDVTGALVFGPETLVSGVVFVEQGRVCWAAAQGLRRRLTDLLRQSCSPPLDEPSVEQLFQQCREQGRPVGEALVEQGHVSPHALRAALLLHTTESLCAADSWVATPRWVAHRARGYRSAFTFLPVELLTYASTLSRGVGEASWACARLDELASGRSSAVFDGEGRVLLGCQLPNDRKTRLRALRAAGTWAAESPSDSTSFKFTIDHQGGVWLGWREGALTFLVHCRDRADFSAQVRALQPRGWASAVHSQVSLEEPQVAAT